MNKRICPPDQSQAVPIPTPNPTPATDREATPTPAPVVHRGVVCDVCVSTIVGVRHKCLDCPGMSP
jgi:next to BRCA1 gene 1 protein